MHNRHPYDVHFLNLKKNGYNNYRDEISRCDLNDEFAGCVRSGIGTARSCRYRLDRLVALVVRDVG